MKLQHLLLLLIISGCTYTIAAQETAIENNCYRQPIEPTTEYHGINEAILLEMQDFNSTNKKSLDIIRILKVTGKKDYAESFKRIFIENGKAYINENNNVKQLSAHNIKAISELFKDAKPAHNYITCKADDDNTYMYRLYVKVNNETVMTFWANSPLDKIDERVLGENRKYLEEFELLKFQQQ